MIKYYLFKISQSIACVFPLKFVYCIAVVLSDFKYFFSVKDKQAVCDNLRVICGEATDVNFLAREVFRNFGRYLVDFFCMTSFTKEFIQKHVIFENRHYLDEAVKAGKGVIIITAHMGNWEFGGLVLGRLGYPLTAIALPHKEHAMNELFDRQRAEGGVTTVPANSAIRRCLHTLKNKGTIALLVDRDFSATGESMSFFGKQTMIPRGVAMLARRTGAVVLPMFLTREQECRFKVFIDVPLQYPENFEKMDEADFMQMFMKQQVAVLERYIKSDPAQWLIFRRFWIDEKTGPERITST